MHSQPVVGSVNESAGIKSGQIDCNAETDYTIPENQCRIVPIIKCWYEIGLRDGGHWIVDRCRTDLPAYSYCSASVADMEHCHKLKHNSL